MASPLLISHPEEMDLGDVLFANDFSGVSRRAGGVATELARESGRRLHIVNVVLPITDPGDSADQLELGRLPSGP